MCQSLWRYVFKDTSQADLISHVPRRNFEPFLLRYNNRINVLSTSKLPRRKNVQGTSLCHRLAVTWQFWRQAVLLSRKIKTPWPFFRARMPAENRNQYTLQCNLDQLALQLFSSRPAVWIKVRKLATRDGTHSRARSKLKVVGRRSMIC